MAQQRSFIAVYIMTNGRNGALYIGVSSEFGVRVLQHKLGEIDGFTKRYGCKRLVWYETHASIIRAIAREKQLKQWYRGWKLDLIEQMNPDWRDLAEDWYPETTWDFTGRETQSQ
jgi:putative endonuclease